MIVLASHDPTWARAFSHEAERITPAFGNVLLSLHHIGSTAIPGIQAKPIIDMLAIVVEVHGLDQQAASFEALGYEVMGEFGLAGRRYYRRNDSTGRRTHHVHAYAPESQDAIDRHLKFRDYLRAHPVVALAYSDLKVQLAHQCRDHMGCYSEGKTAFIRDVEQRAAQWKGTHQLRGLAV